MSRCPEGYAAGFVRCTDWWKSILEIEFVVGEWTCKSIPLFINTGRLVYPDALIAMLLDLCALRRGGSGEPSWNLNLLLVSEHANPFLFS